jgi:hypothetical protein
MVEGLHALTRLSYEPYPKYMERVAKASSRVRLVKWADYTDNWARLDGIDEPDRSRLVAKYAESPVILGETSRMRSMRLTHLLAIQVP